MAIRKFGTEPAKTEVLKEDNDAETLATIAAQVDETMTHPETRVRRDRPQRK